MEQDDYLARWSALHGRYDPTSNALVRRWLGGVHAAGRPLAAAGIAPSAVTAAGVAAAVAAALVAGRGRWWALAAAALFVISASLDGVDGAVAVLQDRTSRRGAIADFTADRCGELLFATALVATGASVLPCVVAVTATYVHEYVRARARVAGSREIGVVTIAERPTRVLVTALFLSAYAVHDDTRWVATGAWAWAVLSVAGLAQLALKPPR